MNGAYIKTTSSSNTTLSLLWNILNLKLIRIMFEVQSIPLYRHCGYVQAVRPMGGWREVYFYSFLTTSLEGVRGQSHDPAALYPR